VWSRCAEGGPHSTRSNEVELVQSDSGAISWAYTLPLNGFLGHLAKEGRKEREKVAAEDGGPVTRWTIETRRPGKRAFN